MGGDDPSAPDPVWNKQQEWRENREKLSSKNPGKLPTHGDHNEEENVGERDKGGKEKKKFQEKIP